MSVDTVNQALTTVRLRIQQHPEHYSPEGQRKLISIAECMRDRLMQEDIEGFNRYVDNVLGREVDATDFLLEELFEALCIRERTELDRILLA